VGLGHRDLDAIVALVRPAMRLRPRLFAGSCGGSDAVSRWGSPDPATPVGAVTGSELDDLRVQRNSLEQQFLTWTWATAAGSRLSLSERSWLATGPTFSGDLACPPLDLRAKPELYPTIAEFPHRTRHVRIPVLVNADGVAVGKTEEFGNPVCVEKIVDVNRSTHESKITAVLGLSDPGDRFQ